MMNLSLKEQLEGIEKELASLILEISEIGTIVSDGIAYRRGRAGTKNIFEEFQMALDVWADRLFIEELTKSGLVKTIASEERSNLVKVNEDGIFNVILDPVDGSSNIKSNNLVATIVSVYEKDLPTQGKNQVAAMYILYGPVTSLVYTTGRGVHEFFRTREGFILSEENIKFPEPGELYSVGGLRKDWLPSFKKYVEQLEESGLKLRYGGSFIGDFNQILHYGGIFGYPALIGKPEGKLRLLFESNPVAFIAEQAGGASSNGAHSILEVEPMNLDQRIPTYVGNKYLIERLQQALHE
jgi:fructose-1,6-bisphosphatase I